MKCYLKTQPHQQEQDHADSEFIYTLNKDNNEESNLRHTTIVKSRQLISYVYHTNFDRKCFRT